MCVAIYFNIKLSINKMKTSIETFIKKKKKKQKEKTKFVVCTSFSITLAD